VNRAATQPEASRPYPNRRTNGRVRAKSSERGSFTPRKRFGPGCPKKTKTFVRTFTTSSPQG
jgi:hypothetical protein